MYVASWVVGGSMFSKFMFFLKHIATEVPEDIAVCEFECNKAECLEGDWRHCERRKRQHTVQQQDADERTGD